MQTLQETFEEKFIDINKLRVALQFMQFPFVFYVNNTELTQEFFNLLGQTCFNLMLNQF